LPSPSPSPSPRACKKNESPSVDKCVCVPPMSVNPGSGKCQ
jgi:hypothetical protein